MSTRMQRAIAQGYADSAKGESYNPFLCGYRAGYEAGAYAERLGRTDMPSHKGWKRERGNYIHGFAFDGGPTFWVYFKYPGVVIRHG